MPHRDPRTVALIVLLCCATLTVMAGATIAPSLPGLARHFADIPGSAAMIPLILTIPGLAIAIMSPIAGLIVDRNTKRHILAAGVVLYIVAGSSGLYLDTISEIIAGRIVLGIAVACVMTSAMALIAGMYSDQERGPILGYQAAAMSFGGVIFIMTGGFLADVSWRAPFAVYLAPILLLPLVIMCVPRGDADRAAAAPINDGTALSFPWAKAVLVYIAMFTNFLIFYTIPLKLPFALNLLGVESAALAGGAIALLTFSSGVTALFFGKIRGLASPPTIAAVAFAVSAAGFGMLASLPSVPHIFALMVLIGVASGVILPNCTTWLYSFVPGSMRGRAAGYTTMSVFTAQFLSAPAVAFLDTTGGLGFVSGAAALTALVACVFYAAIALKSGRVSKPAQ